MLGFNDNHQQLELYLDGSRKLVQKHEHRHYRLRSSPHRRECSV